MAGAAPKPGAIQKPTDLEPLIDKQGVHVLNAKSGCDPRHLLVTDDRLKVTSDDDQQLIFTVPFSSAVRLSAMEIRAPEGDTRPTVMKVYVNTDALGFDEVEDSAPTQQFELTDESFGEGGKLRCNMGKFRIVHSLAIFFDNDNNDETTIISGLKFYGTSNEGLDVANLKATQQAEA